MAVGVQCKVKGRIMRMGKGKPPSMEKAALGYTGKVWPGHQNVLLSFVTCSVFLRTEAAPCQDPY